MTPPYDRLILEGRKPLECRLTRSPIPPFACAAPGQRIYFKRSGGPFFAVAVVDRVWMTDSLTPAKIADIQARFNAEIHADEAYFIRRAACRFATLLWLRDVRPSALAPRYKTRNMRAWYTLDDAAAPATPPPAAVQPQTFDVPLTRGCITQNHVRLAACVARFPADCVGGPTKKRAGLPVTLRLRGGPQVVTDIVGVKKMIRWRGWAPWFSRHGLEPGDRLRFTPSGPRVFDVEPLRNKT